MWKTVVSIILSFLLLYLVAAGFELFRRPHPYFLTRFGAARAIGATAEFQHKSKLSFEIGQGESFIPEVCHDFDVSPERIAAFNQYLKTGAMKFSPYGNQIPPFPPASVGSIDLSVSSGFLVDHIDHCKVRPVTERTGAYELTPGIPIVTVTGIREEGGRAFVDVRWHFEPLNEVVRSLPRVQATREQQIRDEHLTAADKSIAPFWVGSAEFTKYDDGWRVVAIKLDSGKMFERWEYGPQWPDHSFNWNAFDEQANRY